ncbi:MAG: ABC transporter permease subunit [Hespellia sp.]|nr:ABC transporter permease subunit [Hespellia sp.]
MRNLLSAGLMRLRKSQVFWFGEVVIVGFSIFMAVNIYIDKRMQGSTNVFDDGFFNYIVFMGIILAVFCMLFLGNEHGDGTIRNKITFGYPRYQIYLSYLIECCIAAFVFSMTYIIMYTAVGLPLLGAMQTSLIKAVLICFSGMILAFAYVSIYTLIALLNHNKAVAAVSGVVLAFVLLFIGISIRLKLEEPVTFDAVYVTEGEDRGEVKAVENDGYITGVKRAVYEFLDESLPGGQSIALSGMVENSACTWKYPAYSMLLLILTSGIGIVIFTRKDLK